MQQVPRDKVQDSIPVSSRRCSRCKNLGHNARSKNCPSKIVAAEDSTGVNLSNGAEHGMSPGAGDGVIGHTQGHMTCSVCMPVYCLCSMFSGYTFVIVYIYYFYFDLNILNDRK